ncbi:MAG: hypothetical protein QGH40_02025 [bacterium]|jgi:hypothetical protein|nr:hypothetical protein [bacterium]
MMMIKRALLVCFIFLALLVCSPLHGAVPALSADLEKDIEACLKIIETAALEELEEKSLKFIPVFCELVDLNLYYNIDGFIYKDFHTFTTAKETRSFLRDICETAYRHSRRENWMQMYFTEVFHGYYYFRMLVGEYRLQCAPRLRLVLEKLDREIKRAVKTVDVPVDDGIITPDPVFPRISGKPAAGYRINLLKDALETITISFDKDDYRYLYRGSFSSDSRLQREIWVIITMLEKDEGYMAASRVWEIYYANRENGFSAEQAMSRAIAEVQENVLRLLKRGLFEKEIVPIVNWDMGFEYDDFIFFSGDYGTAALYGDMIYIIRQEEPRGIPINEISYAISFYRKLPYNWLISLKGFWLYSFVDRQEYIIPVFISHAEVAGCDIREERTRIVPEAVITGKPGKLKRRYRKYFDREKNQLFVVVLDHENRLMGAFSEKTFSGLPTLDLPSSTEVIPPEVIDYFTNNKIFYQPVKID